MRSMFAGVVGLRVHQTRMDVIGNNVANVNTVGFKTSRVTFQDLFSQTLRGGSTATAGSGGTNPMQIGLGSGLASIDNIMSPGLPQLTGRSTDMAIEGSGFFVLNQGGQQFYTRAGAFGFDGAGYLVNPNGLRVQGWMADASGTFPARDSSSLGDIRIPTGSTVLAQPSTTIRMGQTLDSETAVGQEFITSTSVFDSQGNSHKIIIKLTKTAANTWDVGFFRDDGTTELTAATTGTVDGTTGEVYPTGGTYPNGFQLQFNPDGTILETDGDPLVSTPAYGAFDFDPLNGTSPMTIQIDFNTVTQVAVPGDAGSTLQVDGVDGSPMGSLTSFTVDNRGIVFGVFSNGERRPLAQVAMASFANPEGLTKMGGNTFVTSSNSGLEQIGEPGTGGRGRIAPSNLEMANVDLAAEFTDMIVTQRGFQANSRVITVTDEMLQDLVNLKR